MGGFVIHFLPPDPEHASRTPGDTESGIKTSYQADLEADATGGERASSSEPSTNRQSSPIASLPPQDNQAIHKLQQLKKKWTKWAKKDVRDANTTAREVLCDVAWASDDVNTERANGAVNIRHDQHGNVDSYLNNLSALQGNIWVLDANQLCYARKRGIIAKLPMIAHGDLDDRNKGDAIVKFLALLQISWLILQLVLREVQGLAVSQLEISILAFAISSFVTYCIFWKKPQEARFPMACIATRHPQVDEISHFAGIGPKFYGSARNAWWIPDNSFHYTGENYEYKLAFVIASCTGSTIFSGLHMLAWDFQFNNTTERLFWRISTILTMGVPWLSIFVNGFVHRENQSEEWILVARKRKLIWWSYVCVFGSTYVLARVFMMVETFRTLHHLPPSAYRATWPANVPHFG